MLISPQFEEIDSTINHFLQTSGRGHRIRIHNRPHTDWLQFEWRQLTWKRDGMELGLEIYPNFDDDETIIGWTFYGYCFYDNKGFRHYLRKIFLDKVPLPTMASKLSDLLPIAFNEMQSVLQDEVPAVVALS